MKTNMWGFGFFIILIVTMAGLGYICSSYSRLRDDCSDQKGINTVLGKQVAEMRPQLTAAVLKNYQDDMHIATQQSLLNTVYKTLDANSKAIGFNELEKAQLRATIAVYENGDNGGMQSTPAPFVGGQQAVPIPVTGSPSPVDPRNYACLVPLAWILLTAGLASAAVYIIRRKQTGSGNASGNRGVAVYMSREEVSDFVRYKRTKPNSAKSNR